MLTSFLTKSFNLSKPQSHTFLRTFSSKIKTNRKFGEDAPPKDRGMIYGSKYEKQAEFPNGDLPYSQM